MAENFLVDFDLRCAANDENRARLFAAEETEFAIQQLFRAGRFAEALPLEQELLEARVAVYGEEHLRSALALHSLGMIHTKLRQFTVAEAYWERALRIRIELLGEEDPVTGESLNNLALLLTARGKHFKALPLIETSARVLELTRGEDSNGYHLALSTLHICLWHGPDCRSSCHES